MMLARALLLLLAFGTGCVAVKSETRIVEYPEGTRHLSRVVAGSRTYEASAKIDKVDLAVTLSTKESCEEGEVPIVRRKRMTIRTEAPSSFGIGGEYAVGIGGLALGGLMLASPERVCAAIKEDGTSTANEQQSCVALGWTLVAASAAVAAVAVVDSIRVADREEDLGTREGVSETSTHDCHAGPLANTPVELRLGDGVFSLRGVTSSSGAVTFSMIDAWGEVVPSPARPAQISIGDQPVSVPVTVTGEQHRELSANLLDDPQSRVARDLAGAAQKECDRTVDRARQASIKPDSDDLAVAEARDAWRRAKTRCSALWTTDHQSRQDAIEAAIIENRIGAVIIGLNAGNLDRIDEIFAGNPNLPASLRDDPGVLNLLRKIIGEPARALVSSGRDVDDAQRRLCRARQVFVKIRGADRWDAFKLEVAKNVSELGGGSRSNIIRLMDAARCE